jgi:hypothetical protein
MLRPADLHEPPCAGPAPSGSQESPFPQAPPAGAAATAKQSPLPQTSSPHPTVKATEATVAPEKVETTPVGTSLAKDSKAPLESEDFAELTEAVMSRNPETEKKETAPEAGASAQMAAPALSPSLQPEPEAPAKEASVALSPAPVQPKTSAKEAAAAPSSAPPSREISSPRERHHLPRLKGHPCPS